MFRLTETQLGMFLEWDADRNSPQYNVAGYYRLAKSVDLPRLERAVRDLVAAHPVFRTRLAEVDGTIMQEFADDLELPFAHLQFASESEAEAALRDFAKPFNLLGGELARFAMVETPTAKYLAFDISHLINDGTTWTLLWQELGARYDGKATEEESVGYEEFAAAELESFESAQYAEAAADCKARFADVPATLPEDPWGGKTETAPLLEACIRLDRSAIDAACAALGVPTNLFFMGVFARTLSAFSNEKKVMFCTVNHGRRNPAFHKTFGVCIKTVPVLGELKAEASLRDYCAGMKLHRAGVYPFTHAARDFGLKPGFQFVYQEGTTDLFLRLDGNESPIVFTSPYGASQLPTMQVFGSAKGDSSKCECVLSCLPGKYSQRFVDEFAALFASVAMNFASHVESRLGDIPLLDASAQSKLIDLSRGEDLPTDTSKTFVDLVNEHVRSRPDATALVDCEASITYGELGVRSDALAAKLVEAGAKAGDFVGLMLPRRVVFPIAALAVQKCGAGYVPIDPEYPADRIAYMLEDSEAPVLITTRSVFDGKGIEFKGQVVFVEEKVEVEDLGRQRRTDSLKTGTPLSTSTSTLDLTRATLASPAYMIYTSGSTGKPKGVVVPHRALANLCAWLPKKFGITAESRIATHPSFSFDASVIDIFPALAAGAELHIYSETLCRDLPAMRDYIVAHGITGGTMSTQIGMALIDAYPDLPMKYLLVGGEKLLPVAKTKVRIINGYGPTEFCVCSSYQMVDQESHGEIPIGRPVPNTYSFICDAFGQLLPQGLTGELCLAGPQIAEGYWKRPEKTGATFVSVGWLKDLGQRSKVKGQTEEVGYHCLTSDLGPQTSCLYRTGDYARYNEQSLLEYRGRIDFQVKLRGFRIEIGEIEHTAAEFPGIGAVAAEVREIAGAQHLVLYYEVVGVKSSSGRAEDNNSFLQLQLDSPTKLKAHLASKLTGYMVPDFFVQLDKLPMTPVGKIDRKALPIPSLSDEPVESPANDVEAKILKIAQTVLKTEAFGVTHDFNRLGLTSLGAMALMAKLKKECGYAVSMKLLAENPTVRALAEILDKKEPPLSTSTSILDLSRARPRRSTYPMTENQRGIYADWLRNPEALQYNIPAAFRFATHAPEAVAAAAEKVFAAHPAFKTRFVEKDGEIVQARRDDYQIQVPVVQVEQELDADFFGAAMKPFAPDAEVLARGTVYAAPSASYLFLDIHHTIFDGCSVGIFLAEMIAALDGKPVAAESYTCFDAALDERDYLESETLAEDDAWFDRYLEGAESTAVRTSASEADGAPGELGRVAVRVKSAAIVDRASALGVSLSDWFSTAFTELLRRVGREDDVLVNFVSAGRGNAEVQETVGMFVKTLPLRGVRDAKTFSEAVRQRHADMLELIDRDRYSFARLSERLGVRPDVLFVFEGGIFDLPEGVSIVAPNLKTVKAPFAAIVTPGRDDVELVFEYDRSMYSERDARLLLGMFAELSQQAVTTDGLREIPLLSAADAERVLALSAGEPLEYDETRTFVNLVAANALTRPTATAVVDCETSITYGELVERADALAAQLIELGVKAGDFVGLMLPRRVSFPISALAVQKCGAGYVPIDPEYPSERIAYMLEDSSAPVLITTHALFDGKGIEFSGRVVFVGDEVRGWRSEVGQRNDPSSFDLQPSTFNLATPEGAAYMIYTSGSTGKPKGVVVPHRALRHLCAWVPNKYGMTAGSRIATHPSFSFDASVIDIFPTLACGGELHIFSEELRKDLPGMRDYIVKNGICGCTMSTQIGMALIDAYPDLPLNYLQVGGEKLLPVAKTKVRIINGYGPTEFCVCSSYQVVDQTQTGDIPIGRPVPGTCSLIVDRYGHLLPQGYAGELALAGPQIADGYWRQPEKTGATFVSVGWLKDLGQRSKVKGQTEEVGYHCLTSDLGPQTSCLYRTGDLARYNEAGTLDYMGRLDFQVKLRGFRIEIGEIEHRASTFPGIGAVAAEVREVAGAQHLVLYYEVVGVKSSSGRAEDNNSFLQLQLDSPTKLKAHLAAALADYMVPDYYVQMSPMPLTPNGKINRKLLPSPDGASVAPVEYVEPANETERKIAAAYGEILKVEKYGATMDFFAAGGTSLIGIKAVVALQKAGLDVQYGDIFKYKTPRTLAAALTGAHQPSTFNLQPSTFDYAAYDYTAIDQLLAATPTELFDGFRRHSLGDVLLTGATGYLGIHVLRHLLVSTDATVYALVRPKRGVSAAKRVGAQYVYYFGERIPARLMDRLAFVEGDITDADLGEKLKGLAIGTVINCAALVKHYVADDLMDRVNVGGVKNLIAWCETSGARLVHTSTYSVGGTIRVESGAQLDERRLYVGQGSDNDYVRTKFLAERAVLAAVAAGKLRGKIMRLGNLMGRESDGEFQMNVSANAFVNSLKSYRALGAYPLENLASKIEMSPIDRVAEAVCLLATTPDAMCVFHPYNCYPLDMGAVIAAMNRRGFDVDWVSRGGFAATVDAMRNDPSRADELQGILHYTGHLLKGRKMTPVANDWTTTVLYRLGFRWKPAEDGYLARFFEVLDGLAVFG